MFSKLVFVVLLIFSTALSYSNSLNDEDNVKNFDDLRVSNHHFQGSSIGRHPQTQSILEQINNQIGKTVVQLPPTTSTRLTQQQLLQLQQQKIQQQQKNSIVVSTKSKTPDKKLNQQKNVSENNNNLQQQQQQQQQTLYGASVNSNDNNDKRQTYLNLRQASFFKPTAYASCRWLSLQEFKNISLDLSETIIRDAQEQPCYILSMRAYIMWNNTVFIPLNNLKVLSSKIKFESPSDGASVQSLPLNCSFLTDYRIKSFNNVGGSGNETTANNIDNSGNSFASVLVPIQNQNRPFREEITILADCGYLILETYGDGTFLSLNSISFYQNAKISTPMMNINSGATTTTATGTNENGNGKYLKDTFIAINSTRTTKSQENLVFSSKSVDKNVPLFTIPLISRYICENRVILKGSNLRQLVLERFELQRLIYPIDIDSYETSTSTIKTQTYADASNVGHFNQPGHSLYKRATATVNERFKRNIKSLPRVIFTAVTRCPNPSQPSSPLYSMMQFDTRKTNESLHMDDNLKPPKYSSFNIYFFVLIVIIVFIIIMLCFFISHIIN